MSLEEETALLAPFMSRVAQGQTVEVREIKAAYEEKVGHSIGGSQIYYVLRRHGWKSAPPGKRPKKPNPGN